jgi:battenin
VFKTTRDYYPFWALTYQSFVFLSRSSLSLGVPPIPRILLPLPAILQGVILGLLTIQAKFYAFSSPEFKPHRVWHTEAADTWWHWITHPFSSNAGGNRVETIGMATEGSDRAITIVFLLICLEGLMGGAAYCMSFYHVGREGDEEPDNAKRRVQKAFRMGVCGSADTFGEERFAGSHQKSPYIDAWARFTGVLVASLISMPVEVSLCNAQAKLGSSICKSL